MVYLPMYDVVKKRNSESLSVLVVLKIGKQYKKREYVQTLWRAIGL